MGRKRKTHVRWTPARRAVFMAERVEKVPVRAGFLLIKSLKCKARWSPALRVGRRHSGEGASAPIGRPAALLCASPLWLCVASPGRCTGGHARFHGLQ